ncbi:hypothetical protein HDE68_002937 [Pedobacter cryoconitis]|uniref:Uncharacterized protein n=1 Tax=Pedobacter cryoconitis TaxID=188932 RepID=A0A7W8ZN14_9SPHI|nr:hypothetical protein [Pedobacter cryoconitis]MBB5637024.1 hypothetical protein [Pedobacter cryoconitis]
MRLFDKIFKTSKITEPVDLTTITRTEIIEGFSIPGIILNMHYYYTDVQVYSDGLISCWDMVDLQMFKDKLNKNWITTSVPDGQAISIFSLGRWYIDKGDWIHTKETLYDYVYSLIKRLNPTTENLHNYNGNNSKMIGKANVAKHFIPSPKPYHYEDPNSFLPKKINGEKFHVFFRNDDNRTYLAELSIYKNGRIDITNIPKKRTFKVDDLKGLISDGQITTNLKLGEAITILGLGSFVVKSGEGVDITHKHNEIIDKYNELNGEENSIAKCSRIFEEYKLQPTQKIRLELKEAYESVPEHQRIFVGTMDTKDYEVRQVIYGDIVKNEFEDENGYEYPYDDMPKPIDE